MKTEERRRDETQRDEDEAEETSYLYAAVNTEHDENDNGVQRRAGNKLYNQTPGYN